MEKALYCIFKFFLRKETQQMRLIEFYSPLPPLNIGNDMITVNTILEVQWKIFSAQFYNTSGKAVLKKHRYFRNIEVTSVFMMQHFHTNSFCKELVCMAYWNTMMLKLDNVTFNNFRNAYLDNRIWQLVLLWSLLSVSEVPGCIKKWFWFIFNVFFKISTDAESK